MKVFPKKATTFVHYLFFTLLAIFMNAGTFYHVYNRANGSEVLFRHERNYNFFLKRFSKYINPIATTYSYCLIPNHFHFLIRIKQMEELEMYFRKIGKLKKYTIEDNLDKMLSEQFSNFFNSYAKAYNTSYRRMGSLFIPNFKKKEITTREYLTNVIHYIHNNPIHHGLVKNIDFWQHSSYQPLFHGKPSVIYIAYLNALYKNQQEFKEFHRHLSEEKLAKEMEFGF